MRYEASITCTNPASSAGFTHCAKQRRRRIAGHDGAVPRPATLRGRWRAVSSTPAGRDARVDWLVEPSHGLLRNGLCGQHFRAQTGPVRPWPHPGITHRHPADSESHDATPTTRREISPRRQRRPIRSIMVTLRVPPPSHMVCSSEVATDAPGPPSMVVNSLAPVALMDAPAIAPPVS